MAAQSFHKMKFLQDITFGQYVKGESFIHVLDPRVKLLSVSVLLPLIFAAHSLTHLVLLALYSLLAIGLSGLRIGFILKGLKHFFWLFLFAAVFHAFFTPGEPIPYIAWISYEGADEGARVMVQLMLAIIISNLLTLTTPPMELTMGLEKLLSPLKKVGVPVSDLSMMMLVAIRFIPILKMEAESIVKAQRGRGIDLSQGKFIEKAKNIPVVLVPLIYNSFRRADDLAVAMISRGYVPGADRGSLRTMKMRIRDYISLGFIFALATLIYSADVLFN